MNPLSFRATIVAAIERLIGEKSHHPDVRRRQFLLAFLLTTLVAFGVVVMAMLVWLLDDHPTVWMTGLLLAFNAGNLALLRFTREPTASATVFTVGFLAGLLSIAVFGGGVRSGAMMWLVLIPIAATILLSRSAARWITGLALAGLGGVFVLDLWIGNPWAMEPVNPIVHWISFVCAVTAVATAYLIGSYGERVQSRMRRAVRRRDAELQDARRAEALGRMAGGVAHDFNNLMTVVSSYSVLLRDEAMSPAGDSALDALDDVVGQSSDLTSKLLAYLSKESTHLEVSSVAATVSSLVPEIREELGSDVNLVVESPRTGLEALVDEVQLEQALLAIVANAGDAMPDGGTFTIRARGTTVEGVGAVLIELVDTGVGMPPDVRDRAFEPFFTTKAMTRGTGLGLASVRGIVRQWGGFVELESTPDEGTSVRLWLPLDGEEFDDDRSVPARSPVLAVALPAL